ncbi:MAG: prepilin-type N-terminal cleavage/methylation domain-containing protein [Lachnospiraceae bacterium]|nr:prepilin-type N-terminal cleavage/methylation domain-containing protein [Lachnospiraceae bacterium]
MKNNKGFTLVEMIVAMAIFAVAGLIVFGFASYSSKTFSRSNKDVKLQYEQQTVVNTIRDTIIETSNALFFNDADKTLFVYSQYSVPTANPDVTEPRYSVSKIMYDPASHEIKMGTQEFSDIAAVNKDSVATDKIIGSNVSDFSIDLSDVKHNKVSYSLNFAVDDKELKTAQTIALRNKVLVSDDNSSIFKAEGKTVNSFIQDIVIKRDGHSIGASDEIRKSGSNNDTIIYTAEVKTTTYSEREYQVRWSVKPTEGGSIDGISVSAGTGAVMVSKSVPVGTEFYLYVTSVDDNKKFASAKIKVLDGGVYPVSVRIQSSVVSGTDYREYTFIPTVTYSNGTTVSSEAAINWCQLDLTAGTGCTFEHGVLHLNSTVNGRTFTVYCTTKERSNEGKYLTSNKIVINVEGIDDNSVDPKLKLILTGNGKILRGGSSVACVTWQNQPQNTQLTYKWTITPYDDAQDAYVWGNGKFNNFSSIKCKFNDANNGNNERTVAATDSNIVTKGSNRLIYVIADSNISWEGNFGVMVSVTATDREGHVYETDPQAFVIEPVTLKIKPTNKVPNVVNGYPDFEFSKDNKLKYSESAEYGVGTTLYEYSSARFYTFTYTGINVNALNSISNYSGGDPGRFVFTYFGMRGDNVSVNTQPQQEIVSDRESGGFKYATALRDWSLLSNKPYSLSLYYTVKNPTGADLISNKQEYMIEYDNY